MRIAVFCGSSSGNKPEYEKAAYDFGKLLATSGIGLVYGGGSKGLMGRVADGALENNGEVIGVIPQSLKDKELAHKKLTRLDVVPDMHVRKNRMAELADGFVALPGGPGTLEEIFEQWTWAQLGFHNKPCGFLNINRYYDSLLAMVRTIVTEGFTPAAYEEMLIVTDNSSLLLEKLKNYTPPQPKWT